MNAGVNAEAAQQPKAERYNETEQEIIVLNAVWRIIDDAANYRILTRNLTDDPDNAQLMFHDENCQELFNIHLADLLSKPKEGLFDLPRVTGQNPSDHSYLFYLRRTADNPKFNVDSARLREPVDAFYQWLEHEASIPDVFFSQIDIQQTIQIQRYRFIKICGNIAKHNFSRLDSDIDRIRRVLRQNDIEIDDEQAFLAIDDFYKKFHDDILNYHGPTLAEFLNNIRWGIHDYLMPEFERSYVHEPTEDDPNRHRFDFPQDCNRPLARAMYWQLMNKVRSEPHIPRFRTMDIMKQRY